MDTASITLKFEKELEEREIIELEKNRFIKCISRGRKGSTSLIFKISYPKFIGENNATLVHSSKVVLACNREFVNIVRSIRPFETIRITLNRIDIPYTYIMPEPFKFCEYYSVFYRMATNYTRVYNANSIEVRPKVISDFLNNQAETIILADSKNTNNYNHKITIYNQYQRFVDTHETELKRTEVKHPDLPRRIRIEVSKKIDLTRKLLLEDFATFDLYKAYNNSFLDYAMTYMFGNENSQIFFYERVNKWINIFMTKGGSCYKSLIEYNLEYGESYNMIREALCKVISNKKTRENAITKIRIAVKEYEIRKGIMIMSGNLEYDNIWWQLMRYKDYDSDLDMS